jgi:hypothetical protein
MFEDMVLRIIFGSKGDDVAGDWRVLHTDKFCKLYSSLNIISLIKLTGKRWDRLEKYEKCIIILIGRLK